MGTADPSGKLLMACNVVRALRMVFVVAAPAAMAFMAMMQEFFGQGASVVQGNPRWLFGMLRDALRLASTFEVLEDSNCGVVSTRHQTPAVGFLVLELFVVLLVFILCNEALSVSTLFVRAL